MGFVVLIKDPCAGRWKSCQESQALARMMRKYLTGLLLVVLLVIGSSQNSERKSKKGGKSKKGKFFKLYSSRGQLPLLWDNTMVFYSINSFNGIGIIYIFIIAVYYSFFHVNVVIYVLTVVIVTIVIWFTANDIICIGTCRLNDMMYFTSS